jgi:hypothetical protein
MDHNFFFHRLYPIQDAVLARMASLETDFYLTEGTAASRAQSKAAGLFPADVARALLTVTAKDWNLVRWIEAPDAGRFIADLSEVGERLLLLR